MAHSRAHPGPGEPGAAPPHGARPGGAATATSATHQSNMAQLRAVLRQYISSVLLDSVMQRALDRHHTQLKGPELYEAVTADCMIGLRMFVSDTDLPELMLALADFLEQLSLDQGQPPRVVFTVAADGIATIDARGRSCPLPIVFASYAMRQLRLNEKLRVLADDRAFAADIRAWSKRRHHVFLGLETKPSHVEALIQKSG